MGKSGALEKKVSDGRSEPRPEMRVLKTECLALSQGDEELKSHNQSY